jgi:DNA-binding NtrC family response regulator
VKLPSVLVVDDDDAVSTVLKEILRAAGFAVSATSLSNEATAMIKTGQFGVLIYDLSVSAEQGPFQFLASCLNRQPSLSILLITGFADHETRRQAANLKIRLLEKPFGATDLLVQLFSSVGNPSASARRDLGAMPHAY